jgi:hypothetical protein
MPGLPAAVTLDLWEGAEGLRPVERALALAAAAEPPTDATALAALPLGRRDARLLRLRTALAGETLEATAACPSCGEVVEFAADVRALLARDEAAGHAVEPVELDGFVVRWRPPDSRDVAAAAEAGDEAGAERVLLARCVTSATGPDGAVDGPALPAAVRGAVAEAMAAADPLAEVLVDVACPACERSFVADLDVAGFVWAEIREEARRVLHEVDVLARAYGWTEDDVVALSPRRRAAYLRLAREGAP